MVEARIRTLTWHRFVWLVALGGLVSACAPISPGPAMPPAPTPPASNPPAPTPTTPARPPAIGNAPLGAASYADRPDDVPGEYQFHVLYVMHKAYERGNRDLDGSIVETVRLMNDWFTAQSGGRRLRFDTYQGELDITRLILPGSDQGLRNYMGTKYGAQDAEFGGMIFLRNGLEDWINDVDRTQHLLQPGKLYVAFYETSHAYVCADGPPPGSRVVGLYPGAVSLRDDSQCAAWLGRTLDGERGVWEQILAHELIHALGFPGACSSHPTDGGTHVDDPATPSDIMGVRQGPYSDEPVLDPNHDDYFATSFACPDLSESPFLDPLPDRPRLPRDVLAGWRLR